MTGKLKTTRKTRRDAADEARLKHAGDPAHINADEARLLAKLMPEAAGPVVTRGLLAEAGRRGDDRVTRLIPAERALLKARGGSGTRNPLSGMLEYWDSDGGMSGGEGNDSVGSGGMSGDSKGGDTMGGGGGDGPGRLGYRAYDHRTMPAVESLLAAPSFMPEGMSMRQYAPRDTLARLMQEWWAPSVKAPGRLGAPNAKGPGIMGSFISQLAGGPFSAAMSVGGAMGRASSPATQAASAAEDAARSGHNSAGQQQAHDLNEIDAKLAAAVAGERSGAETAKQPVIPPGYTMNPAGQIVPSGLSELSPWHGSNNRPAYQDPIRNLLHDYIWRGPNGRGWGW